MLMREVRMVINYGPALHKEPKIYCWTGVVLKYPGPLGCLSSTPTSNHCQKPEGIFLWFTDIVEKAMCKRYTKKQEAWDVHRDTLDSCRIIGYWWWFTVSVGNSLNTVLQTYICGMIKLENIVIGNAESQLVTGRRSSSYRGYTINRLFTTCMTITWDSGYASDSNSTHRRWGTRLCISNKLP